VSKMLLWPTPPVFSPRPSWADEEVTVACQRGRCGQRLLYFRRGHRGLTRSLLRLDKVVNVANASCIFAGAAIVG